MGFSGLILNYSKTTAIRQQVGFSGFRVFLSGLTPVMVQDARGRGLSGVNLVATNPTSGIPFSTETDANGNALMQLDASTEITATRQGLKSVINHNGANQEIIILQSSLLFS